MELSNLCIKPLDDSDVLRSLKTTVKAHFTQIMCLAEIEATREKLGDREKPMWKTTKYTTQIS